MLNCLWPLRLSSSGTGSCCRVVVFILLLIAVSFPCHERPSLTALAKPSGWEPWDAGLSSFAPVVSLAIDPGHPDTLYAGTYSLPGLWYSIDGGYTWAKDCQGPCNHPALTLLWDSGHQRWWAGTAGGLFFRPAASANWQSVSEFDGPVFSLMLDVIGHVYVVAADRGLFRGEEDGSWTWLRREPQALTVAVSSTGRHIFIGTSGKGLWISHDAGETWHQVPDWPGEYVSTLLIEQDEGGRIYASTSSQVYDSEDFGRTWQSIPELDERAYTLALAPDGALYVGLTGRVARSQDRGQTWSFSQGNSTGLNPQMPILDLVAVRQPGASYKLYAGTRDGVYWSTDQGRTWQRHLRGLGGVEVEALTWDGEGGILAATPSGLYQRPPGNDAWQPVAPTFRGKRFYALSSDAALQAIYAGMQNGLVKSTDGGKTWKEVVSDLSPLAMPGVLVDPDNPDHVFIRLAFERVYESRDGGETWEARWEGMEIHHVVLCIARSLSGELWAGTQDGLFRWDQQSESWERVSLPATSQSVFAIAFEPEDEAAYVGATGGLWCRRDRSHWVRCGANKIDHTVTALAVLPDGYIYAGTRYSGLYRSCDAGMTWHRVLGVPDDSSVSALLTDTQARVVYAATDRGLFRGYDSTCPPSERPPWHGATEESGITMWLRRMLFLSRYHSPAQTLPAVHTLRADDKLLQLASDMGFQAVVQVLSWEEAEPTPGEWHWEYADFLARAADFYDLGLIVRLDHPPEWALQGQGEGTVGHTPPFDMEAYLRFVEAVARRYQGQVQGYIIWNEPNLAREWGAAPDPISYTWLLQRAYIAIKRNDPLALVISAGLSPTNAQPAVGGQNDQALDDRIFLEHMYQAGARPFFDALGAHPYGFAYPPDDPPGAHAGLNFNRILDLRATMEAYGDESKPVWATEVGWTTHGTGEHAWLTVTPQEQSEYLACAWQKAQDEFPWLRGFTVWNLSYGLPERDEKAGYSLLHQDGTPKPACEALQQALSSSDHESTVSGLGRIVDLLFAPRSPVFILAAEEEVHLGDSQ
jgi:photosystem II stability/assembly factor-like uncharacterized protein